MSYKLQTKTDFNKFSNDLKLGKNMLFVTMKEQLFLYNNIIKSLRKCVCLLQGLKSLILSDPVLVI